MILYLGRNYCIFEIIISIINLLKISNNNYDYYNILIKKLYCCINIILSMIYIKITDIE